MKKIKYFRCVIIALFFSTLALAAGDDNNHVNAIPDGNGMAIQKADSSGQDDTELTMADIAGTYEVRQLGEGEIVLLEIDRSGNSSLKAPILPMSSLKPAVIEGRSVKFVFTPVNEMFRSVVMKLDLDLTGVIDFDNFQATFSITTHNSYTGETEDEMDQEENRGVHEFKRIAGINPEKPEEQLLTMIDIMGKYEITFGLDEKKYALTLNESGNMTLDALPREQDGLDCEGPTTIEGLVVRSQLRCDDGTIFVQKIDLTDVSQFNNFVAPVFSSIYGVTNMISFQKKGR